MPFFETSLLYPVILRLRCKLIAGRKKGKKKDPKGRNSDLGKLSRQGNININADY